MNFFIKDTTDFNYQFTEHGTIDVTLDGSELVFKTI